MFYLYGILILGLIFFPRSYIYTSIYYHVKFAKNSFFNTTVINMISITDSNGISRKEWKKNKRENVLAHKENRLKNKLYSFVDIYSTIRRIFFVLQKQVTENNMFSLSSFRIRIKLSYLIIWHKKCPNKNFRKKKFLRQYCGNPKKSSCDVLTIFGLCDRLLLNRYSLNHWKIFRHKK